MLLKQTLATYDYNMGILTKVTRSIMEPLKTAIVLYPSRLGNDLLEIVFL